MALSFCPSLSLHISLYNLLGERIREFNSSDESITINADDLPSGLYIVKAENTIQSASKKVVVE